MYKTCVGVIFLVCSITGFGQINYPDYSNLTKRQKLELMNVYGFLTLKNGDTIFAEVSNFKQTSVPITTGGQELIVSYPKGLEKFRYLNKIPLDSIKMFYHGFPKRRFIEVKQHQNKPVLLEKIIDGKYLVYKEYCINKGGSVTVPNGGLNTLQTGNSEFFILYISKNKEELIALKGSSKEKKQKLARFFEGELSKNKIEKLKVKNHKVIDLFNKLNSQ